MTTPIAGHRVLLERSPDGWRTVCSCGWISSPTGQDIEAILAHLAHATEARTRELFLAKMLTKRQQQVLRLVAEGLTDREIAHELGCSIRTIHSHVYDLTHRLGATSRTHAAVLAIRAGLIPLDPANPTRTVPAPVSTIMRTGVAS